MALDAGTRFGPYEVVAALGAGGMGEVYRARDVRLGRDVALKVVATHHDLNSEVRQRFAREAKAIAALSHPNICSLFDVGSQDGSDYLVMELLEGESLAERLGRGPLPLDLALRWGGQILAALARAHRSGIVHRDLKPANVMVTANGVKLLDFGLAQLRSEMPQPVDAAPSSGAVADPLSCGPTRVASLTSAGMILGTLQYMAPEQLEGKQVDGRSDLFAFGAMLYEMVTGAMAFPGSSMASVVSSILRDQPMPLSQRNPLAPAALERLVARCLAKDPEERWQSAHDLRLQLEGLAAEGPAGADSPGRVAPRSWPALLGAGLLAAAVVGWAAARYLAPSQVGSRSPQVRFQLSAPADQVFRSSVETIHVAVSPDGRTLAFVAIPERADGGVDETAVWLRSLGDDVPRRLAGSEGATSVFWSPTGDEIGYFAGGRLKRQGVAEGAGAPVVICEVAVGPGMSGTWGRDAILFASIQGESIQRVGLGGDKPEILLAASSERDEFRVQWPWFLADGVSFLYVATDARGEGKLMHVPAAGGARVVAPIRSRIELAAPDVLLFAAEGALYAQRFDASASRLIATPVSVAPFVANFDATKYASFGASQTGTIVVGSGVDDGYLAWYDLGGRELGRLGEPGARLTVTISGDGRRALSDRYHAAKSSYDVSLLDLERGVETLLVSTPSTEAFPIWTPGDLGFVYSVAQNKPPQLMRRDFASSSAHQLLDDPSFQIPVEVLKGGNLLLLRRTHQTGFGLYSMPMPAADEPAVAPQLTELVPPGSNVAVARVSPDQKLVAYLAADSGRQEAYLRRLDGTGAPLRVSSAGAAALHWSADGTELLFVTADRHLLTATVETEPTLRIVGTEEHFQLPPLGWTDFDVAPDGRILAIVVSQRARTQPLTVIAGWSMDR